MMDKSKSRKPCWRLMWTSCEKRVACSRCLRARTISVWPLRPSQLLIRRLYLYNNIIQPEIPSVYGYFSIRYEISNKYEI